MTSMPATAGTPSDDQRTITADLAMIGKLLANGCGNIKANAAGTGGKICIQPAGHDGDHSSGLAASWPQDTPPAPFTLSTPPPRKTEHAAICEREDGHYGECGTNKLYLHLTGRADEGLGILQADLAVDDETGELELRSDFGADDWEVTSSAQFRRLTAAARAHLDALDALADRYDAITGAQK